jgi:HAMP domain-containing protein
MCFGGSYNGHMNIPGLKQNKRIYLVNRDFQLRYAYAAAIVGLLSTLVTSCLILYPLYQFEILRIPRFLPWPILLIMLSAAFFNIALVGFLAIHVTHRLAGPMYSLVRQMRHVESGRWNGTLKIRQGDDLKYVVRNFNEMLSSLKSSAEEDREAINQLLGLVDKFKTENTAQTLETMQGVLHELKARLSKRIGE